MITIFLLNACSPQKNETKSEPPVRSTADTAAETKEGYSETMEYDFEQFSNVNITGIDIHSLDAEELAILYAQARYCQAMADADIDTMRELVSEDMLFTHMSGRQQTREKYFADVADGSLDYFTIGIADPVIKVDGDAAVDASLQRLGVDYIDLMILHHSQPSNDVDVYQAMERAVEAGKLRSIGLSNYYEPEDFERLVNATTICPALLQNETHPYHQSGEMKEHIAQYGTALESWFPLGGRSNTQTLFNDPVISGIAQAHGVSSAQVIIRWHLQAGNICIPGSSMSSISSKTMMSGTSS